MRSAVTFSWLAAIAARRSLMRSAARAAAPATAQPEGYEALGGIWQENDWQAIDIGPETVTMISGGWLPSGGGGGLLSSKVMLITGEGVPSSSMR